MQERASRRCSTGSPTPTTPVGIESFAPIGRGLAAALAPAGQVLGIDLAARMIELTAADASGLPQVELCVADATALGLAPASFDVVASSLVLFILLDPTGALRTWRDLLWLAFARSHGQRAMWDVVTGGHRERLRDEALEAVAGMREDDGRVRLGQHVRYTLGRRPG